MNFDLEYEANVFYLLDELAVLLKKRTNIIFKLLSSENKKTARRKRLLETDQNLLNDLREATIKSLNIIEQLDKTINESIPFLDIKEMNSKIQNVTNKAINTNTEYVLLQKEGKTSKEEDNRSADLRSNMKNLANRIEVYNGNFKDKLITFKQAREKYIQAMNESFDF